MRERVLVRNADYRQFAYRQTIWEALKNWGRIQHANTSVSFAAWICHASRSSRQPKGLAIGRSSRSPALYLSRRLDENSTVIVQSGGPGARRAGLDADVRHTKRRAERYANIKAKSAARSRSGRWVACNIRCLMAARYSAVFRPRSCPWAMIVGQHLGWRATSHQRFHSIYGRRSS